MNPCLWMLATAVVAACASLAPAQDAKEDPLHALVFSPQILLHHREAIGLSDDQVEAIREQLAETGPQAQQQQQQLANAMGRFAELLAADEIDEDESIQQLDRVLAIEKELKHLQFRMMIRIRNELTPEQRQSAAKLQQNNSSPEIIQQRLQSKISRIEEAIRKRAEAGDPPFDAIGLMQKFPEFMENGQVKEAEALLDQVLKLLEN